MTLWLVTARTYRSWPLDDHPCPCIEAHGIGGNFMNQWWIEEAERDPLRDLDHDEAIAAANAVRRIAASG